MNTILDPNVKFTKLFPLEIKSVYSIFVIIVIIVIIGVIETSTILPQEYRQQVNYFLFAVLVAHEINSFITIVIVTLVLTESCLLDRTLY